MNDNELADALRRAALLEGDFTLRSGRKSKYYLDKYLFETQPDLLREIARRFANYVDDQTNRIAGAELGGIALAAATALHTNRPFIIVRNSKKADYGTGNLIEGRLAPGERVLLLEDVATTGGQAIEAAKTIQNHGAHVTALVAVIDRLEGARQNVENAGLQFDAILTVTDLGIQPNPQPPA